MMHSLDFHIWSICESMCIVFFHQQKVTHFPSKLEQSCIFSRFIEGNKIEMITKYAFRGLRDITHLWVASSTDTYSAVPCECTQHSLWGLLCAFFLLLLLSGHLPITTWNHSQRTYSLVWTLWSNCEWSILPMELFSHIDFLLVLMSARWYYFYIMMHNLVCSLLNDGFGRDLRGNMFECDCRAKWLIDWLKQSNATVSDVYCAGPADRKGMRLKDVPDQRKECLSTGNQSGSRLNMSYNSAMMYSVVVFNKCWRHVFIFFISVQYNIKVFKVQDWKQRVDIFLIFFCLSPLCIPDFVLHQSLATQSMSADIFSYKEDIYVAMAVPNSDSCVIMEWDHIEIKFRPFDTITG